MNLPRGNRQGGIDGDVLMTEAASWNVPQSEVAFAIILPAREFWANERLPRELPRGDGRGRLRDVP